MSLTSISICIYNFFQTIFSDFADIGVYAHICACHDKAAQRHFGSINDALAYALSLQLLRCDQTVLFIFGSGC